MNMVKSASDCYLHQLYDIKVRVKRLLDKISRVRLGVNKMLKNASEGVQNHSSFGIDIQI